LPKGIRALIYSYLPLNYLIKTISKISRVDRKILAESEILD
jgi:hypothetical protein